jgi:hypothetical protein
MLVAHHHSIDHGNFIELVVVLTKHSHAFARINGNISARRVDITRQYFKKSGLTGTVGTDHTIAVSTHKLEVGLIEQHPLSKLQGYIIYRNHLFIAELAGKGTKKAPFFGREMAAQNQSWSTVFKEIERQPSHGNSRYSESRTFCTTSFYP